MNLRSVPFNQVTITDRFWAPKREINRTVSIPHSLDMLEKAGNVHNLELAATGSHTGFSGPVFMDSDLYKCLEAASYSLATHPDPALAGRMDAIIAKIAAAQRPDGYIDTYYEVNEPTRTLTNLRDNHELYCMGHMIEAAVAHFQATGTRPFLDIAIRAANFLSKTFGEGPGKRMGYPGHPELELALVKLYRVTGDKKYLDLAQFFITHRGSKWFATEHHLDPATFDGTYWQDEVPINDLPRIMGHAVRAAYLMSGATDVAGLTGDADLLKMVRRVWRNTTERNTYLTGGIGSSAANEGFTTDYDLPNLTAYQETCATVAMAMWNERLFNTFGDARYADCVEKALYNGVISGVSLDGTRFFYGNPLESTGGYHRSGWFSCACCPPNVTRTLAQLGGYAYAQSDSDLWVNLYIQGEMHTRVAAGAVGLRVTTDYPWDGAVKLQPALSAPARFALHLRIPGWCHGATASLNGAQIAMHTDKGYLVVDREWTTTDTVELNMPMPVEHVLANPNVKADVGLSALQRGPLIYCLEGCDQSAPLNEISIPRNAPFKSEFRSDLLNGVVALTGTGETSEQVDWLNRLYAHSPQAKSVTVTAVPYYAWDNRAAGAMSVWMPTNPPQHGSATLEGSAAVTLSFTSGNAQPWAINDGHVAAHSGEQPAALCHWWPHKGTAEWAQYTFKHAVTVDGSRVYWFDDTGRGECRLPAAWGLEYLDGAGAWKPVTLKTGTYTAVLNTWSAVTFAPVKTTALRLAVQLLQGWAAGVHQWQVSAVDE